MSSPDLRLALRAAAVCGLALLTAACFRPLYADTTPAGVTSKDAAGDVAERMRATDVKAIEGRVGEKVRDELFFMLRGGAAAAPTAYRITVLNLSESGQAPVADPLTSVPETRSIMLNVKFQLARAGSLDPLFVSNSVASATFTTGLQRFANVRAERDAEDRAAKQIASQIRSRVQAYYATGQ